MTISSFTSISLHPPLALISVAAASPTWERIAPTGRFAVNLLGEHQEQLARRFAAPAVDRFRGVGCEPGPDGLPILSAAHAAAVLRVVAVHRAGDHDIVLGEPERARLAAARPPLVHHRSG